jgi:hypothetical protein
VERILEKLLSGLKDQKRMIEELLEEVLYEESEIRKSFLEIENYLNEKEIQEIKDQSEHKMKNEFIYMRNVLQEDIRLLLIKGSPNPKRFKEKNEIDDNKEENALEQLISLVRNSLIREGGTFYNTREDFEEIRRIEWISERLEKGKVLFELKDETFENDIPEYKKPRYIISAFCYLYFLDELIENKPKFTFFKAFNSTIFSMAWSRNALNRFSH